jgi:hypothetical protein
MTSGKASSLVFGSGILVFGMGWFYYARKGEPIPPHKFIIGTGLTFLAITFTADINADLAAAMATAVATTAFFHYGTSLMTYINQTPQSKPHHTKTNAPAPRHVGTAPRGFTG